MTVHSKKTKVEQRTEQVLTTLMSNLAKVRNQAPIMPTIPTRTGPRNLSLAQERIWFLEQVTPGTAINNVSGAVFLPDGIDTETLRSAVSAVVARHDPLRARIRSIDGQPRAVIRSDAKFTWRVHQATCEAAALAQLSQRAQEPMDLEHGPMLIAVLYLLPDNTAVFGLTIHHIACDGWSVGLIMNELITAYDDLQSGGTGRLGLPTFGYFDYADKQKQVWVESPNTANLSHWLARFDTLPPDPCPWTDGQSPGHGQTEARRLHAHLDQETTSCLRRIATTLGATPFVVLLALWKVTLHRLSHVTDICVGVPMTGRDSTDLEGLVGFFVNLLPIRSKVNGDMNFRRIVTQERAIAIDDMSHGDMPFELLLQKLKPEQRDGWRKLLQVGFAYHAQHGGVLPGPTPVRFEKRDVFPGTSMFDALLSIEDTGGRFSVTLDTATARFGTSTSRSLLDAFCTLAKHAVRHPNHCISQLPISSPPPHTPAVQKESRSKDHLLSDCFAMHARKAPHSTALLAGEEALSYAELDTRANQMAHALSARGVEIGDLVGLCMRTDFDVIAAMLAVWKCGAAFVPMDPTYPLSRLETIAELSAPKVILVNCDVLVDMPQAVVWDSEFWNACPTSEPKMSKLGAEHAAYVIYTSGTTGLPKGVVVTHHNVMRLFSATQDIFQFDQSDTWALFHSICFDASVWEIWGALLYGGRLVIADPQTRKDPMQFARLLARHRVTSIIQTPSAFRGLIQACLSLTSAVTHLKTIVFGGEALDFNMLHRWVETFGLDHPRLFNMYGITETTVHVTCKRVTETDLHGRNSIIGLPLPDLSVTLIGSDSQPVPQGFPGEICVGGAGVSLGYMNNPKRTAEVFAPDPLRDDGAPCYLSGDLARHLPNGELEYLGRIDQQIKNRGHRIEPVEIEQALRKHPQVQDCVVRLRKNASGQKLLTGYVYLATQDNVSATVSSVAAVFDEAYGQRSDDTDDFFDISGWISSTDRRAYSVDEMQEWVDWTIHQLTLYAASRIYEIGCGTGLLASQLARQVDHYLASDISEAALSNMARLRKAHGLTAIKISQREAKDFGDIPQGSFDLVLLNSVSNYLPSDDYLADVVHGACAVAKPEGTVFIGDVRDLRLLDAFHIAIKREQTISDMSTKAFAQIVQHGIDHDSELLLDPRFFNTNSGTRIVEHRIKRGTFHTEMNCFRYDVILHPTSADPVYAAREVTWSDVQSMASLKQLLTQMRPTDSVTVTAIPNCRIASHVALCGLLKRSFTQDLGLLLMESDRLSEHAVDPQALFDLADALNLDIRLAPSLANPGEMHALFSTGTAGFVKRPWCLETQDIYTDQPVSNSPQINRTKRSLIADIKQSLADTLPTHAVPDVLIPIDHLPLTPNGKLDSAQLPMPVARAQDAQTGTPPRPGLEAELAALWAQLLGTETINREDDFFELGGHSLLAAELMFLVSGHLGIEMRLLDLFTQPSLAGMAAVLATNSEATTAAPSYRGAAFWTTEAQLPDDIRPTTSAAAHLSTILLTGCTGFTGPFLVAETLKNAAVNKVICLVRAATPDQAEARLRSALKRRGLWVAKDADRISVIMGDLDLPRFGLTDKNWDDLSRQIDGIIHNGASVNLLKSYEMLKPSNVSACETILRLACQGPTKRVTFVSSIGVFDEGDMTGSDFRLMEATVPSNPETLDNGYAQGKWVSEMFMRTACARGVPMTILRPTRIGGHSQTAAAPDNDALWQIVRAIQRVGAAPDLDLPLDIVPVDVFARATVAINFDPRAHGASLHIANPVTKRFAEVADWLGPHGRPVPLIPYPQWKALVSKTAEIGDEICRRITPLLRDVPPDSLEAAQRVTLDTREARKLLSNTVTCPPITRRMFRQWFGD